MKPVHFKESNITFAKDQPEYQPLPALKYESQNGEVVTCWNLSFVERIRLLITGKVWMSLLSFNQALTPSFLTTKKSEVIEDE